MYGGSSSCVVRPGCSGRKISPGAPRTSPNGSVARGGFHTVSSNRASSRFFEPLELRQLLSGDVVLEWNSLANEAVRLDHGIGAPHLQAGPTGASRALAIVHAAIYDAVNA